MILWPDLNACLVGAVETFGQPARAVYDHDKIIALLMHRNSMTEEDAEEFLQFNIAGAYHGPQTPAVLYPTQAGETIEEFLAKWEGPNG